jgi:hypothetical protein
MPFYIRFKHDPSVSWNKVFNYTSNSYQYSKSINKKYYILKYNNELEEYAWSYDENLDELKKIIKDKNWCLLNIRNKNKSLQIEFIKEEIVKGNEVYIEEI